MMAKTATASSVIEVPSAPRMSEGEIALFGRALDGCHAYLEYGAGGSTGFVLNSGVERMVSIESDKGWVEALRQDPRIVEATASGRLHLLHGDIGPTREWGFPVDKSSIALWPSYPEAPWPVWEQLGESPSVVLVDGRFRIACALRAGLCFIDSGTQETARILCHDVSAKRPAYDTIFEWFDKVEVVDTLVLAQLKPGTDRAALASEYKRRLYWTI